MSNRLLWTVLALAWVSDEPAFAQAPVDPVRQLDAVEVTGSRLRRTDTETPAPVQVITREDIARSGAASLYDVMQTLPAANAFTSNENDAGRSRGASGVSLRGLGESATLILINGRRVASFGFNESFGNGTFVDLNQIPIGAIDRIEVLLDGASAVYGSDAVAGVVNVILRRSFRGAEVTAGLGRSSHGDADQRTASLTLGFGELATDGYNVLASLSHLYQAPIKNTARWHSASGDYRGFGLSDFRSTSGYPGNLYTADNRTFLQVLPGCTLIAEPGAANAGQCVSELVRDLASESQRDSLLIAGTASLPLGFELFGDALIGRNAVHAQNLNLGGTSYSANGTLPAGLFRLPVGHPQNPYPFEVALRTRFADEPRILSPISDTQRVVVGLRHRDVSGWDVEGALLWSRSKTTTTLQGVIDESVLHSEVFDASGRAFPTYRFGDPGANDPALMARLYPRLVDVGKSSMTSVDLRGTREMFRLPGGPAQLAVGAELRRERFSTAADPRIAAGSITVLSGSITAAGNRTLASGYAELSLPVTRTLEASLAERYDHYSDFGGTTNSKAGVKWQAMRGLALRSTFGTAFRAPGPIEIGQGPVHFFSQVRDPKKCPVPDVANPSCDLRVRINSEGNPALKPERAMTTTAGIVFEPWPDASFTVDAFRIRRRDQILSIDTRYLLAHEDEIPGLVVRNPDGTISEINRPATNIGAVRTWGIDATGKVRADLGDLGRLGVDGTYAWLPHFWVATTPDAPLADYAGTYFRPKSRARLSFSLDRGPWRTALTFNYTGKYLRALSPADLSCPFDASGHPELCSVKAWRTTDLFIGYTGFQQLELGLLVSNLDNVQAPLDVNAVANNFTAYLPGLHSAVGRFFKLTAKYSFR